MSAADTRQLAGAARPAHHHRGLYRDIEHPVVGVYDGYLALGVFPEPPAGLPPAPFSQSTSGKSSESSGTAKGRVAHLYERRVTSDEPFVPG